MAAAPALPKTIEVGPFRYSTITGELARLRMERGALQVLNGQADHDALTIMIDPTLAADNVRETLLHEILHACAFVTGLSRDWGKDREEEVVRRLSPLLLDVLRRNPALVAFILAP